MDYSVKIFRTQFIKIGSFYVSCSSFAAPASHYIHYFFLFLGHFFYIHLASLQVVFLFPNLKCSISMLETSLISFSSVLSHILVLVMFIAQFQKSLQFWSSYRKYSKTNCLLRNCVVLSMLHSELSMWQLLGREQKLQCCKIQAISNRRDQYHYFLKYSNFLINRISKDSIEKKNSNSNRQFGFRHKYLII